MESVTLFGIGVPELIIILIIFAIPFSAVIIVLLITKQNRKILLKERYMFCTKCGSKNDDNAFKCTQCGNTLQGFQQVAGNLSARVVISNYLAQAILVTLFCCIPFGIPAIVYSAQVNSRFATGDYAGAMEKSKKAKFWCWVSFWAGLGLMLLWFIVPLIAGIASA